MAVDQTTDQIFRLKDGEILWSKNKSSRYIPLIKNRDSIAPTFQAGVGSRTNNRRESSFEIVTGSLAHQKIMIS